MRDGGGGGGGRRPGAAFVVGIATLAISGAASGLSVAYALRRDRPTFTDDWFLAVQYGAAALGIAALALMIAGLLELRGALAGGARTGAAVAAAAASAMLALLLVHLAYVDIWLPAHPTSPDRRREIFDGLAWPRRGAAYLLAGGLLAIAWIERDLTPDEIAALLLATGALLALAFGVIAWTFLRAARRQRPPIAVATVRS